MIHVVATLAANPGKRDFILEEFKKMRPATLREDGCIQYEPVVDADGGDKIGPDRFLVIEKWEAPEKLDAHMKSAHLNAFLATVKPALARITVNVLTAA
ncbi:putative quinol monooxygenase [Rhizobium calliandrae]|uniref:Antibiotic biosynthesis monooxygenase n=2 Tax=Rhizobium TaxID=379 RepID=A0A387FRC0_9HYPH|nr:MULTISPECIES: putative quinol monooxygenase [Rhizobium]AYG59955.1 antibiotic biosynthesis monooxygenase [Rhizobium jaguaris]MDL2406925.1 putative quinol monooxygenase [Rhizobium calliandrae]